MGNSSEELISQFPFKVNTLGYISDQDSMISVYACADMFVIPSLEDNLPNTIMESMACGTPCVGFEDRRDSGDDRSFEEWVCS